MKSNSSWRIRLAQFLLGAAIVFALVAVRGTHAGNEPVHLISDWSHKRLVFSAPHDTFQHIRLLSNPRYVQQLVRRNSRNHGDPDAWRWRHAPEPNAKPLTGDWSMNMGTGAKAGAGVFPAKFSFDPTSAYCQTPAPPTGAQPDFVVYNTSLSGIGANVPASSTGTFTGAGPAINQTATIKSGAASLVLFANTGSGPAITAGATITVGPTNPANGSQITLGLTGNISTYAIHATVGANHNVLKGATTTLTAENLAAAIDHNSAECGSAAPCFGTLIASANAAVTHPVLIAGTVITLTAVNDGAAGNFTITTNTANIALSPLAGTQGNGANDGPNFLVDGASPTNTAANFVLAINRPGNGSSVAVTASSSAGTVTLDSTANSAIGDATTVTTTFSNFTAFGTPFSGGSNAQATIGAFTNLYSSCTAPVPSPYWAYNTGTTGAVVTSPVLSGDGSQVAFVQNTATASTLVLLKWKANDGTFDAPTTPTNSASAGAYQTCVTTVAACMFTIPFDTSNGGAAALDGNSSPFYDYSTDTLYVGNNNGFLHQFTGVFKGAPAEVVSIAGATRWPALIVAGQSLTSPVFVDGAGGLGGGSGIFVGDRANRRLYRVDATAGGGAGGVVASGVLGSAGIDDSPLIDSTTGMVYVFVRGDNGVGAAKRAAIYQFNVNFSPNTLGLETPVASDNTLPLVNFFPGTLDNTYYSSVNGTGSMYVCSTSGAAAALWQVTVTAGVLSAPTAGPILTTVNRECSPITEFPNGATDWIFLSVTNSAVTVSPVTCPAATGCVMSFDVSSGLPPAADSTASETGGTSGIVVDGSSAVVGASQVYFTPLANQACTTSGGIGGCAIQAAQSGLN
jgi:hypothetical protein